MDILTQIAEHLLQVSEGDNWTDVNLKDTLKDVAWDEATMQTKASKNTIASLVHHLAYWNRVMVLRLAGVDVAVPTANGFDMPKLKTEEDWINLQKDYTVSVHELMGAVKRIDIHMLWRPILPGYSSVYKNIQGSVEHVHYHLGQIVLIKHLVRRLNGSLRLPKKVDVRSALCIILALKML